MTGLTAGLGKFLADIRFEHLPAEILPLVYDELRQLAANTRVELIDLDGDGNTPIEYRLGHISGAPYAWRNGNKEKDEFHEGLEAILKDKSTLIRSEELKQRLLAEHPFLTA